MRTIKRISIDLNFNKQEALHGIAKSYAQEKQFWLKKFQKKINIPAIKKHRSVRDQAIASEYKSSHHLQARMWKLALQDAADTMNKYWQSIFEKIKRSLSKSKLNDTQKHYLFWLLKDYKRFVKVLSFVCLPFKNLPKKARKQVIHYINRGIRKYHKNFPKVKLARSFLLDANCYSIFTHEERQYISIMSLVPGKRLILPLSGSTAIQGNCRIVVNESHIEVHYTADLKGIAPHKTKAVIAIDFGYSEVFTDCTGEHYNSEFGNILKTSSDALKIKMKNRHKLHALQKKYADSPNHKKKRKARNIKKYNLGMKKLDANQKRLQATLNKEINTAFNKLARKDATIIVSEDLSHSFDFNKGKNWNRRLSAWVRGMLKERLEFKALAKGFSHYQVNPAYSSQTCIPCGFVDSRNRKGNKFQCQYCRYENHADWVAAMNLKSRYFDREITRYTHTRDVKRILLERFHRRLETRPGGLLAAGFQIPQTLN